MFCCIRAYAYVHICVCVCVYKVRMRWTLISERYCIYLIAGPLYLQGLDDQAPHLSEGLDLLWSSNLIKQFLPAAY